MYLELFEKDDPETWHAVVWRLLKRACEDSTSALRHPILATQSTHGPQARVVLLRSADPNAHTLTLFTDARSPKAGELHADPRAAWTFWDPRLKLQIRARSVATLHQNDARAEQVRAQVPQNAWRDYTSLLAPSAEAQAAQHDPALFTQNFCVIDTQVQSLDILALRSTSAGGHKRLRIDYADRRQAAWLVP
jgi:pyridoxine/pyridoxamine 5'-phosphate oxidase